MKTLYDLDWMDGILRPSEELKQAIAAVQRDCDLAASEVARAGLLTRPPRVIEAVEQMNQLGIAGERLYKEIEAVANPEGQLTAASQALMNSAEAFRHTTTEMLLPTELQELSREWERIMEAIRHEGALAGSALSKVADDLFLNSYVESCLSAINGLRELSGGRDYHAVLGFDIGESLATSLRAMEAGLLSPGSALLAGDGDGGLLSWMHYEEDDLKASGAMWWSPRRAGEDLSHGEPGQSIVVTCRASCRICDGPLFAENAELRLNGDDEVEVGVKIVPFCPACVQRDSDEPGYLARRLEEIHAVLISRLELVDGDGEGDGVPRGTLFLVKSESDDDTGEDR